MCSTPKIPEPAPPPAAAPNYVDRRVQGAHDRDKRRQRTAAGRASTILTGGSGVTSAANTGKTVLGG